mmetsp:Transcript_18856/g.27233  ORF Transcript_18856/g.27233 Transcript_18856/m.27233 type:complete len:359 (+) Transcript_18856:284-1360(+)
MPLVICPVPIIFDAAIGMVGLAVAMPLAFHPVPIIFEVTIGMVGLPLAIPLVIPVAPLILESTVGMVGLPLTVPFAVLVVPLIPETTAGSKILAMAVLAVICPVTLIARTVSVVLGTPAMAHTIPEASLITVPVIIEVLAVAVALTVPELPLVARPVGIEVLPQAVLLAVHPVPLVAGPASVEVLARALPLAMHVLALVAGPIIKLIGAVPVFKALAVQVPLIPDLHLIHRIHLHNLADVVHIAVAFESPLGGVQPLEKRVAEVGNGFEGDISRAIHIFTISVANQKVGPPGPVAPKALEVPGYICRECSIRTQVHFKPAPGPAKVLIWVVLQLEDWGLPLVSPNIVQWIWKVAGRLA